MNILKLHSSISLWIVKKKGVATLKLCYQFIDAYTFIIAFKVSSVSINTILAKSDFGFKCSIG